ncbi:hypothetical protein GCM10010211_32570 [Streptomyces albospinus]|uniref:Calpain catalytic domain-containing protein n=1 Tax=Streptomyces albospinus TaxID=285515 RepID=A0ABQ2V2X4_9ACTN|nr:hypothetical protein GCM10010211_32570 [Streptomyces albospinus]
MRLRTVTAGKGERTGGSPPAPAAGPPAGHSVGRRAPPLAVVDQSSALDACYIIVSQGEGAPDEQEDSHYEKFTRIRDHVDGIGVVCDASGQEKYTIDSSEAVWPVMTDPKASDFTGSLGKPAQLSDAACCYVLALLDALYQAPADDPDPSQHLPKPTSERYGLERGFIAAMQGVLSPVAKILVSAPIKSGPNAGRNAGPTFGYYDFNGAPPKQVLMELCTDKELTKDFPQLGGGDGILHQISLLPDFTIQVIAEDRRAAAERQWAQLDSTTGRSVRPGANGRTGHQARPRAAEGQCAGGWPTAGSLGAFGHVYGVGSAGSPRRRFGMSVRAQQVERSMMR